MWATVETANPSRETTSSISYSTKKTRLVTTSTTNDADHQIITPPAAEGLLSFILRKPTALQDQIRGRGLSGRVPARRVNRASASASSYSATEEKWLVTLRLLGSGLL
jgi:hypothetical protein